MKISTLIGDIVKSAEAQFGVSGHNLDCINVYVYCTPGETNWQVGLTRPSPRQLDSGEVLAEKAYTIKQSDNLFAFHTERSTLLGALLALQVSVDTAFDWEDGHVENYRP